MSTFQQVTPSLLAMLADEKKNDPEGHDRSHVYDAEEPSETTTNTSNETNENTVGRRARFQAEAISLPSSASSSSMSQSATKSQRVRSRSRIKQASKPWLLFINRVASTC